ncbi:MAG: hypothetical protein Q4C47_04130 [Planctomycetia bacterium]|nr:hypothetical protein [Planctomycetia bacterium]
MTFSTVHVASQEPEPAAVTAEPTEAVSTVTEPVETGEAEPVNAEGVLLRYRFEPGEVVRYDVSDVWSREVTKGGVTHRDEASSHSEKVWTFLSVTSDGEATFENSLAWVDMRRQTAGESEVRYDSRKDHELPAEFRVTPDTETVTGKVFAEITINSRGETVNRVQRESTATQAGTLLPPLPENRVKLDEPWYVQCDTEVPIPETSMVRKIRARQRYVVEKVEGDIATIRMTTQIFTPITDPQVTVQTLQLDKKITMKFDLKRGKLLRIEQSVNRHIVGFSGAASVLRYRLSHTETLL